MFKYICMFLLCYQDASLVASDPIDNFLREKLALIPLSWKIYMLAWLTPNSMTLKGKHNKLHVPWKRMANDWLQNPSLVEASSDKKTTLLLPLQSAFSIPDHFWVQRQILLFVKGGDLDAIEKPCHRCWKKICIVIFYN